MKLRLSLPAFAAVAALMLSAAAGATTLSPPSVTINGWTPTLTQLGCTTDANGVDTCTGSNLPKPGGQLTLTNWSVTLNPDPTVTGFLALQNNLQNPQTFSVTFLLPIVPQGPQVQISGSIGGSVTDANGNGATLTNLAPTSIYNAQIDAVTVKTLLNDPQSFSAGAFGSTTWGGVGFGPTTLGQSANSSIAINVIFTLSPGDLASFTSVFNVIAVPEPATLAMMTAGLAGLLIIGKRHRS